MIFETTSECLIKFLNEIQKLAEEGKHLAIKNQDESMKGIFISILEEVAWKRLKWKLHDD